MKKQIIIVVAIALLFVGLSGCNEFNSNTESESDITSISEINSHPNRYLNKEITVKAFYWLGGHFLPSKPYWYFTINDDNLMQLSCILNNNTIDKSILIVYGEYYWTGVIEQNYESIRLNVTYIEPV